MRYLQGLATWRLRWHHGRSRQSRGVLLRGVSQGPPQGYNESERVRLLLKHDTAPKRIPVIQQRADIPRFSQKYSRYLPVYDQQHGKKARKSSVSKETLSPSSRHNDRNARASVDSLGKRRSTMNSRAAYDEDEVLRKVLEESKHEGGAPASENGNRKKRSRDDSEE